MSRARRQPEIVVAEDSTWAPRLANWGFLLAIVLVCARATMSETLRDPFDPAPGTEAAPRGVGPAATLFLNLLGCIPALLVLGARAIEGSAAHRLWSVIPMGLLAAWALASTLWASDRFAAMVGATTWASALALLWAMAQLVRSWPRLRLVTGAAFGILLIYIACGLEYRYLDLPELRRDYSANRSQILRERGLEEGSFAAQQFERKVLSGDTGCFSNSPNTYAATLVLLGAIAGGVLAQRLASRDWAWIAPILLAFPPGLLVLYHTRSRTAFATALLGTLALLALKPFRGWLAARARFAYWAAIGLFVGAATAVVGHGLAHGNLVEKSLTFRWYYWSGAARLVEEHPLLGVGWNNFGLRYLTVRGPLATEEVQDPHNLFMKIASELGLLGAALLTAWLLRLAWELTRPQLPPLQADQAQGKGRALAWLVGIAGLSMLLNLLVSTDWSQPQAWLVLQSLRRLIGAAILLLGLAAVALASVREERLDQRPAPWILYGLLVGLGLFFLHTLLDFALFETGPMYLFALLAGSALGLRSPDDGGRAWPRPVALGVLATGLIAWLLAAGILWGRTAAAETSSALADAAMRASRFREAARLYDSAFAAQPLNGDYSMRAAEALILMNAPADEVRDRIDAAIAANPAATRYYSLKAQHAQRQSPPDSASLRSAYESALRLDPRSIRLRLAYAEALLAIGDRQAAAQQYRQALDLDAQLPPDEPKRLTLPQRQAIEHKL